MIYPSPEPASEAPEGVAFAPRPEPQARLRELRARILAHGPRALDDAECLELLCELAEADAPRLLAAFGSLPEVLGAPIADVVRVAGEPAAARIKLAVELADRLLLRPLRRRNVLSSWSGVVAHLRTVMVGAPREQFRVLFLDKRNRLLAAQLREACLDAPGGEGVALSELRELALNMPAVARTMTSLHRRYRDALDQAQAASARLGDAREDVPGSPTAYEQVRDLFYSRRNHIAALDAAAEALAFELQLRPPNIAAALAGRLRERHAVALEIDADRSAPTRRFLPGERRLILSPQLTEGQRAFQSATQIALLEYEDLIDRELVDTDLTPQARALGRVGLASYFAGAAVLPYGVFLQAAEASGYDIEALSARFGVGLETICHRLSTLQRRGASGVPFIFVRTDRAGNISKRQSATDFHFSRFGGVCPLWGVYETFAEPGRIRVQLAEMPDGRRYIWIATAVRHPPPAFGGPETLFSIGLGCDLAHAPRLIYARGLDLDDRLAFTPIGLGCKVCDRPDCAQRAFPPLGRRLVVDAQSSSRSPYRFDP